MAPPPPGEMVALQDTTTEEARIHTWPGAWPAVLNYRAPNTPVNMEQAMRTWQ